MPQPGRGAPRVHEASAHNAPRRGCVGCVTPVILRVMPDPVLLSLRVNGGDARVAVPPHWTLLEVLRYALDLVGSKQGCDKGDCGACTVQVDGAPTLACLTLGVHAEGHEITTVEGLGFQSRGGIHPLQDAFDRWNAAQCGFCTPGILMSAAALIRRKGGPVTREEAAEAIAGNLCRCTGYTKILDAIVEASEHMSAVQSTAGEGRSHG